jgi:uncharacterized membrane-anchored protein
MTAKHNAKHARQNLWVSKQRAAEEKSSPARHTFEAIQRRLAQNTRASRAVSTLIANLAVEQAKAVAEAKDEPAPSTPEDSALATKDANA